MQHRPIPARSRIPEAIILVLVALVGLGWSVQRYPEHWRLMTGGKFPRIPLGGYPPGDKRIRPAWTVPSKLKYPGAKRADRWNPRILVTSDPEERVIAWYQRQLPKAEPGALPDRPGTLLQTRDFWILIVVINGATHIAFTPETPEILPTDEPGHLIDLDAGAPDRQPRQAEEADEEADPERPRFRDP